MTVSVLKTRSKHKKMSLNLFVFGFCADSTEEKVCNAGNKSERKYCARNVFILTATVRKGRGLAPLGTSVSSDT